MESCLLKKLTTISLLRHHFYSKTRFQLHNPNPGKLITTLHTTVCDSVTDKLKGTAQYHGSIESKNAHITEEGR